MSDAPNDHVHAPRAGCPMCAMFETVQDAQPEATEHLVNAAREFIRAGRAMLDAAEEAMERHWPEGQFTATGAGAAATNANAETTTEAPAEPRVRRIDIA